MTKIYTLREWSTALTGDDYTAPELREVCLMGLRLPPHHLKSEVKTSAVVAKVGPKSYRTRSGNVYVLDGAPERGFVEYCKSIGKPLDLDDPIKFLEGVWGAA